MTCTDEQYEQRRDKRHDEVTRGGTTRWDDYFEREPEYNSSYENYRDAV